MKEFEPRPFQKEVFEKVTAAKLPLALKRQLGRPTYIGIDMAEAGGDKTVVAQAAVDKKGKMYIYYDEYSGFPSYKCYRNPIKWWKWRRLMKMLERHIEEGKKDGTIWTSSTRS